MARHLVEPATDMITAFIQGNIATALAAVSTDRNTVLIEKNKGIAMPIFKNTFIAPKYDIFLAPALFVMCDSGDNKKSRGANHRNAVMKYNIVAVVENKDTETVARQAWRYQAALSEILDNKSLTSADQTFKIVLIEQGFKFSEESKYTDSTAPGNAAHRWRKAVLLEYDVEFYEQL